MTLAEEELDPDWQLSGAVPPAEAVRGEALSAARLGQGEDVLEVGGRRCERADYDRVARAARHSQRRDEGNSRADLESPGADVLVRQAVAGEMCQQAKRERGERRSRGGADRAAGRDVKRDDHAASARKSSAAPARDGGRPRAGGRAEVRRRRARRWAIHGGSGN